MNHKYSTITLILILLFSIIAIVGADWENDGTFTFETEYDVVINPLYYDISGDNYQQKTDVDTYIFQNNASFYFRRNTTNYQTVYMGDLYSNGILINSSNFTIVNYNTYNNNTYNVTYNITNNFTTTINNSYQYNVTINVTNNITLANWTDINGIPDGFADNVDNDTQLTQTDIETMGFVIGIHTVDTNCSTEQECPLVAYKTDIDNAISTNLSNHPQYVNLTLTNVSNAGFVSNTTVNKTATSIECSDCIDAIQVDETDAYTWSGNHYFQVSPQLLNNVDLLFYNSTGQQQWQISAYDGGFYMYDSNQASSWLSTTRDSTEIDVYRNINFNHNDALGLNTVTINPVETDIALTITQPEGDYAMFINSDFNETKPYDVRIEGKSQTSVLTGLQYDAGMAGYFYRNVDAAITTLPVFRVRQDLTTDDQDASQILNDGTGSALFIDQNGDARSIEIDTEATTGAVFYANQGGGTQVVQLGDLDAADGSNYFYRNAAAAVTNGALVYINQEHESDDRESLFIKQDASADAVVIDMNGNENALYIDTEASSADVLIIDTNTYDPKFDYQGNLTLPNIASCDAVETDGNGELICGTDEIGNSDLSRYVNDTWTNITYDYELDAAVIGNKTVDTVLANGTVEDIIENQGIYLLNTDDTFDGYLIINQNDDNRGLFIDSEASSPGSYGIYVDTPANGATAGYFTSDASARVYLSRDPNNSADGTNLITRNLAAASTNGAVLRVEQDNVADDQPALVVQQDGIGVGFDVYGYNTASTSVDLFHLYSLSNILTTMEQRKGGADTEIIRFGRFNNSAQDNWFFRNLDSDSTAAPVLFIEQDNAGDDQEALQIQQDGTGVGLLIDQNGNGIGLKIDTEATSANAVTIDTTVNDPFIDYAGNLTLPNIASCSAVETDGNGELICGTDETGNSDLSRYVNDTWTNITYDAELDNAISTNLTAHTNASYPTEPIYLSDINEIFSTGVTGITENSEDLVMQAGDNIYLGVNATAGVQANWFFVKNDYIGGSTTQVARLYGNGDFNIIGDLYFAGGNIIDSSATNAAIYVSGTNTGRYFYIGTSTGGAILSSNSKITVNPPLYVDNYLEVTKYILSPNWTNTTILEDQILDLDHYTDADIDGSETAFDGWDKDSSDDDANAVAAVATADDYVINTGDVMTGDLTIDDAGFNITNGAYTTCFYVNGTGALVIDTGC